MKFLFVLALSLFSVSAQAQDRIVCSQDVFGTPTHGYGTRFLGKIELRIVNQGRAHWGDIPENQHRVTFDASGLVRGVSTLEYTSRVLRGADRWAAYNTANISNVVRFDGGSETAHSYVTIRDRATVDAISRVLRDYDFERHRDRYGNEISGLNGLKVEDGTRASKPYWSFRDLQCSWR